MEKRYKKVLKQVKYDTDTFTKEELSNYLKVRKFKSLPVISVSTGKYTGETISAELLVKQPDVTVIKKETHALIIPKVVIVNQDKKADAIKQVKDLIQLAGSPTRKIKIKHQPNPGIVYHAPARMKIAAIVVTNPKPKPGDDDDPPPIEVY